MLWESIYPVAAFALGTILTATFLIFGLWIGYKVGRASPMVRRGGGRRRRLGWLRRELAECANLAQQTTCEIQRFSSLSSNNVQSKSQEMQRVGRQLVEHSTNLCERLQKLAGGGWDKPARSTNNPIGSAAAPETESIRSTDLRKRKTGTAPEENHSSLSPQELGQITELEHGQVEAGEDSTRRRFAYDCVQSVLAWHPNDVHLPSISDGITVRCHDISGQGISFFWPSEPDFDHLIISLGNDQDLLFMAAQVMHFKPIDLHGVTTYLVGCRFIRRVNELTLQWQRELSRHAGSELARSAVAV